MHDVAVIGGGVLGLSVAYACLARGLSTAVYEAGRVGDGASGGIVGALSPHSPDRWNAKKAFQLAALRAAPSFWGQIEQESGRPTGYAQTGRVMLLTSARARAKAEAQAAEAALRWGGATWAVTEAPDWLAPSLHGVVRESLSAKLFPRLAVRALAEAVRRRGGEIHEQTPVRAEGPGFATSASPLSARRMVIAAGLPGFRLAGLGDLGDSVKGQAALLDVALPAGRPMVYGDGLYILGQGRQVAVGSTSEPGVETPGTDLALDALIAKATAVMPSLQSAPVAERWWGLRARAKRRDPMLGPLPGREDVLLALGGFKIGFGLAPEIGRVLAAMAAGEAAEIPESFTVAHHLDG